MELHQDARSAAAYVRRVCGLVWVRQMHSVQTMEHVARILGPRGAMEAFEAAQRAGTCRFIGSTGHYDPHVHAALLKAYPHWDSVLMPVDVADHACLSFEETVLPVARQLGISIQAIKVFCKAFLLRSLNPTECRRYTSDRAFARPSAGLALHDR
jgi:aryl-alcohol dehydrogenase-like predicted oxidoreductase